jgi:phospholipid/cholesterol/gamma-HCH transport system substrate-binding protein
VITGSAMGRLRLLTMIATGIVLSVAGCTFEGLNSLPLPGAVGRGPGAELYHVQFANIGTLESNSPVMLDDVVVGSVGRMTFSDWHVDVELSIKPDAVVPANALASIGQTSLLGSMHVALDPPLGQAPAGRLARGATIPLDRSSIFPSTEQTLSSVSAVVNGGGLGQIGDIIHNFNAALSGRQSDVRDLLSRLDQFIGVLDTQRANIIGSIQALNRLAGTFAEQQVVIERAIREVPPALDVLIAERPRITTALDKLRVFSDTATRLVNDTQADLVTNLGNLAPTMRALADVGDGLDSALAYTTVFPYGQGLIDRAVRGDYMNLFEIIDLTVPRLKNTTLLGTRWGEPGAPLVPAPGEPAYLNYTWDPLMAGVEPATAAPPPAGPAPVPPDPAGLSNGPVPGQTVPTPTAEASPPMIFAGPYGPQPPARAAVGGN